MIEKVLVHNLKLFIYIEEKVHMEKNKEQMEKKRKVCEQNDQSSTKKY